MGKGRLLLHLSFAIVLSLLLTSPALAIEKGEELPAINVKSYSGANLTNAKLKGKVTVINFWATWCEACKVELVEMTEKFTNMLKQKDFKLVLVSLDKDPAKSMKWAKANLSAHPKFIKALYKDPSFSVSESLGVDSFPFTVVLDREGRIQHIQRGYKKGVPSTDKIVALSGKLLVDGGRLAGK